MGQQTAQKFLAPSPQVMANPGDSVGHNLDELGCRRQPETEGSSRNVWLEDSLAFEVHGANVQT